MSQPDRLFIDEALGNFDAMDGALRAMQDADPAAPDVDALFRRAHSIKGGAAAFGLSGLAGLMHQAEYLLDHWRKRRLVPSPAGVALLRDAVALGRASLLDQGEDRAGLAALTARLAGAVAAQEADAPRRSLRIRIAPPCRVDLDAAVSGLFRDVAGIGRVVAVSEDADGGRLFDVQAGVTERELVDLLAMQVDRSAISVQVAGSLTNASPAPAAAGGDALAGASLRVTTEELDALGQLAQQLSQASAALCQILAPTAGDRFPAASREAGQLRDLCARLDDLVHQMRTAAVSELFALVQPLLDVMAAQLDKPFTLVTAGDSLRLSRPVLQGLVDPLIQLVRNSCDHGIESQAQRLAAGKSPLGRIGVTAAFVAGAFELTVQDDGQGLSRTRLLQVARERGLAVADDMPDASLWPLVFQPGLSTAARVTPVSGRGVGMDLVKHRLDAMGGSVSIACEPSRQTTVTLSLPIDIAVGVPVPG